MIFPTLSRNSASILFGAFCDDWEHWAAELLESHLSYPVLTYYRSQHDRQSWLAALTAILDSSALLMVGIEGAPLCQAHLTFAMARHAVVDLALIFNTPPTPPVPDRLPAQELTRLRFALAEAGSPLHDGEAADERLAELRGLYEPYVFALAEHLLFALPPWLPPTKVADDWETTAWEHKGHFTGGL